MINMNYNINFFVDRYYDFINNVSKKYNYSDNITHLIKLLLIVFVIKYDIKNEKVIMACFEKTKILISEDKKSEEEAFFYRNIFFQREYISNKYIVINGFYKDNYIELIDTLIHEFNHAINSMVNEITFDQNHIYLRTGISYLTYSKNDLNNAIAKSDDYILEEVINTYQTVEIVNIIKNFDVNKIESLEFSNFVIAVQKELTSKNYVSKAYFLESNILEDLVKNKTFIFTLQKLRFTGEIKEIENWFDAIVDIGEYKRLIKTLKEIFDLEKKYISRILFKKDIEIKIKQKIDIAKSIVEVFNKNSIYR